jgi:hypothetical protein
MSADVLRQVHSFLVKEKGNPFFTVQSHNIEILHSPIDFYLAICVRLK